MGSSGSKAARTAAGAATRKYPRRVPPTSSQPQPPTSNARPAPPPGRREAPGPTLHPQARASTTRDEAIDLDASDPDFAASLRSLGAVQPSPTLSNSSTFNQGPSSHPQASNQQIFPDPSTNPAILLLKARDAIAQAAEREFMTAGKRGHEGRQFLDVITIRQVLMLRDEKGVEGKEIERRLGLKPGVVARLGGPRVVGDTSL